MTEKPRERRPHGPALSRCRLEDDLGPAVVARVEVLVGLRRLVERQLVQTMNDGLALPAAIRSRSCRLYVLTVAWPVPIVLALEPEQAVVEGDLRPAWRARRWRPGPAGTNTPTTPMPPVNRTDVDQVVQRQVRVLVALRVVRLVADALAAAVRAQPMVCSSTARTGSTFESSIGDRADRLGQPQPVGVPVDDHDLAGARGSSPSSAAIRPTGPAP